MRGRHRKPRMTPSPSSFTLPHILLFCFVFASEFMQLTSAESCPQCVKDSYPLSFPVWRQVFGYVAFVLTVLLVVVGRS